MRLTKLPICSYPSTPNTDVVVLIDIVAASFMFGLVNSLYVYGLLLFHFLPCTCWPPHPRTLYWNGGGWYSLNYCMLKESEELIFDDTWTEQSPLGEEEVFQWEADYVRYRCLSNCGWWGWWWWWQIIIFQFSQYICFKKGCRVERWENSVRISLETIICAFSCFYKSLMLCFCTNLGATELAFKFYFLVSEFYRYDHIAEHFLLVRIFE